MKSRRASIANLCAVVAVVAFGFGWALHVVKTRSSFLGFRGPALDAGAVPMVGLLIFGTARILMDGRRLDRRTAAPIIGCLAGLSLYLAYNYYCVYLDRHGKSELVFESMRPVYWAKRRWPGLDPPGSRSYHYWAAVVYYGPPQFLVALVVAAFVRGRPPKVDPPSPEWNPSEVPGEI